MKIGKHKEIDEKILALIIVSSCLIFFILGFSLFESTFYMLIILWIAYLVLPAQNNRKKSHFSGSSLLDRVEANLKESKQQKTDNHEVLEEKRRALTASQKKRLLKRWECFGEKDAICPSCGVELEKFPKRKVKCKKSINRGKNYFSGSFFLFADKNNKLYEELLWLSNGTWKNWFDNYSEIFQIKKN